jgi:hypothetical protein
MSVSEPVPAALRHVVVLAENPMVEVHLVDHSLRRIAQAWGRLEADVPPGLYLAKFKAGASAYQEPLLVEPGPDPLVHHGQRLALSSSIPVYGLPTSHEYQTGPAQALSRKIHEDLGGDAEIFLFARDWENQQYPWYDAGRGLVLRRPTGEVLLDLAAHGARDDGEAWAGANIRLPAGGYVLRSEFPAAGIVEMPIVASPGFQTQVFLTLAEFTLQGERTLRLPDFSAASVRMAPLGDGFHGDPDNPLAKLTAIALAALAAGRKPTQAEDLGHMLRDKFEDPMLGILGAHLLLLDEKRDDALLQEVANNLTGLVGDHPDVLALRKPLGGSHLRFDFPPMLLSSWRIASSSNAIPSGTFAALVSPAAAGQGPWLTWRVDLLPRGATYDAGGARALGRDPSEALDAVRASMRFEPGGLDRIFPELTPAARHVVSTMARPATVEQILDADDAAEPVAPPGDALELARQAGLPISLAANALDEIAEKLGV